MADVQSAKGVRDFNAQEKFVRDEIIKKLITVFERYGFLPLETSMLERLEVLTAKFAAGEGSDASNEIFKLKDQGNRDLGLRFDLTVPLSRYVSQNPKMKMPFKRYEIGRVYRDGPIKLGRYREFWQCDVDVIGCDTTNADAEIVNLALDGLKELGLDAYLEINSRKLLDGILEVSGIPKDKWGAAIIVLDKLKKIGKSGVEKELETIGVDKKHADKVLEIMKSDDIADYEKILTDSKIGLEGVNDVKNVLKLCKDKKRVRFTPSLARGLSYYTGMVFEAFLTDQKITSSICGGGRYDNMIGLFLGDKKGFPAVGISFGLEPITEYMKLTKKVDKKTTTQLYVIPMNTFEESKKIASYMRDKGVNTEIDLMGRSLSKNFDYANYFEIPYCLIIGEDEINSGKLTLKNMKTGKEEKIEKEEVAEKIVI